MNNPFTRIRLLPRALLLLISISSTPVAAWGGDKEHPQAMVTEAFIEMRTAPGRGYPVFNIAERGETIVLLKQKTDWVKIRNSRNIEGWVHTDSIERTVNEQGQQLVLGKSSLDSFSGRRWETGLLIGDQGGTEAISAYAGYQFTRNLGIEVDVTENFGDFSSGRMGTINLVHQLFPQARYSPFLSIGAGIRETSPRSTLVSTADRIDNTASFGAGMRVYFTRKLLLRLQFKHYVVMTERDDDEEIEEWKIGISAVF